MFGIYSANPILRTGARILFALALSIAAQSIGVAAADDAPASSAAGKLVQFDGSGSGSVVPNSDSPEGCLKAGKTVCSGKFTATTTSTLWPGVSHVTGTFTLDFTKPEISAVGVCFPQITTGIEHTPRGEINFVQQGRVCIPPASAGLAPGYDMEMKTGLDASGTGAFAHLFATYSLTVSVNPSGLFIYRFVGVASGVGGDGK